MALPTVGQISVLDVYEERWGGPPPSSGFVTLEALQSDWQLPETPDNVTIFEGRGIPEGTTQQPTDGSSPAPTIAGNIDNAGGYSGINCDWRFRYRLQGGSDQFSSINTVSGTFTGQVTYSFSAGAGQTYEYELQLRNIHDDGAWQTFNTVTFTVS